MKTRVSPDLTKGDRSPDTRGAGANYTCYDSSRSFDPDSYTIRDAKERRAGDKGAKTADDKNPVPRATGFIPAKPTAARSNF